MRYSEQFMEHIEYAFAAFCRIVLRNAALNAYRDFGQKTKREVSLDYLMSETSFEPFTTDNYFEQYKPTTFVVKGQKVIVVNERLADALSKLPKQRRTVLLLFIYVRAKNAKNYRRDAEYGSARWGVPKDIAPFVDPVFENNIILTGTEFLTMNPRPKNPANARNLNACVIGSSGSGKTRFWLTPQLLQASAGRGAAMWWWTPRAAHWTNAGPFYSGRAMRCGYSTALIFPAVCTITPCPISVTRRIF